MRDRRRSHRIQRSHRTARGQGPAATPGPHSSAPLGSTPLCNAPTSSTRTSSTRTLELEDVLSAELIADEHVDAEYLRELLRDPQAHLAAPGSPTAPCTEQSVRTSEGPLARRAKVVGLVLATTLLSGSVIGAAVLADQKSDEAAGTTPATTEIVGAAALGVFALPQTQPGEPSDTAAGPTQADAPVEEPAPPASPTGASGADSPPQSAPPANTAEPSPSQAAASTSGRAAARAEGPADSEDHLRLVREFYRLVTLNPPEALQLLAPELRGDQPGELVRAWSSMESITLSEAQLRADDSVLAVVMMVQPDGEELRVTQLLEFSDGPESLISQARLLSTQHT